MIKFISRHDKDYSRYNIIKDFVKTVSTKHELYILLPFSKNQFFKHFFKRDRLLNDFFISNYDTYVNDRKKISKYNPRAWWKYLQDWINFRCSHYLLSDTYEHFKYWETLFGTFQGKLMVLPVLADQSVYYPLDDDEVLTEKKKILFYGSFIPLHGIDVILDAFKILEDEGLPFEAKVIGNGQIYSAMKEKFDRLGLKQVEMEGALLPETELANEIRASDIVLGIFGESKKAQSVVPNKVYQSLACKKATITMESKAIEEFFGTSEIVSCSPNATDLAYSIRELADDDERRRRIAATGYNKFCKLVEDSQQQLIDFLNQIDKELD